MYSYLLFTAVSQNRGTVSCVSKDCRQCVCNMEQWVWDEVRRILVSCMGSSRGSDVDSTVPCNWLSIHSCIIYGSGTSSVKEALCDGYDEEITWRTEVVIVCVCLCSCGTGVCRAVCRLSAKQISWEAVLSIQTRISDGDQWKSIADAVSSEWNWAACLWQHGSS